MAQFAPDTNKAGSSLANAADNQVQTKNTDMQNHSQGNHAADNSEPDKNSSLHAPKKNQQAPAPAESQSEDPSAPLSDQYTKEQEQILNTDEQTRYPVGHHTDDQIYYSYAENPEPFPADNESQIQSVPERLPAGQLIDTTTDDETQHITQISGDWNLILVNPWNEVPKNYEINLTNLPNGHSIDSRCYPALMEMMNACRSAGLHPLICSSYRTQEKQESLFQERVDELRAQGYSKKDARIKAATSVARPGTSEHQIGLAVDLVDQSYQALDAMQEYTPVQQWLMENSWKYGFILRYPNDKSRLTGIIYEPWHYRYVGLEAAQEIYERGICLEEYLEEQA